MAKKDESSYESLATFPLNMLPNELQKRILYHVPTHDAVRYKTVCKEWQLGVEAWASGTLIGFTPQPQKAFYFMFNVTVEAPNLGTYAYNSDKQRWVSLKIPNSDDKDGLADALNLSHLKRSRFDISASGGLVCIMDAGCPDRVFVCNPILRNRIKLLPKPPSTFYLNRQGPTRHADYWSITLSTDNRKRTYDVALIRSTRTHIINCTHNTTIHLYKSDTRSWANLHSEKLGYWHVGDSCVICKDVLYGLVRLHRAVEDKKQPCYAIVAYNLSQVKQEQCLAKTMAHIPCLLTSARLLNLNDKLIVVGGVKNPFYHRIGGIMIWEMCAGNGWREITHAPDDLIRHFFDRNYDGSIMCSGYGELIFIQDCNSTAVLTYELDNNRWAFLTEAPPFPVLPHNYMTFKGFCFEPRLDIVP